MRRASVSRISTVIGNEAATWAFHRRFAVDILAGGQRSELTIADLPGFRVDFGPSARVPSEDKSGWSAFLRHLVDRGLKGVQLIISMPAAA